jgi:hypothetical protein
MVLKQGSLPEITNKFGDRFSSIGLLTPSIIGALNGMYMARQCSNGLKCPM